MHDGTATGRAAIHVPGLSRFKVLMTGRPDEVEETLLVAETSEGALSHKVEGGG